MRELGQRIVYVSYSSLVFPHTFPLFCLDTWFASRAPPGRSQVLAAKVHLAVLLSAFAVLFPSGPFCQPCLES